MVLHGYNIDLLPPYFLSFPICFASYFDVLVHLFIMLSLEPVFFYSVLTHIKHFSVNVGVCIGVELLLLLLL